MSIETDLKSERISHLNLHEFTVVQSETSVQEVVEQMRHERRNCAFVLKDNHLLGIFTERDILRKVVMNPETWEKPVDEVMTASPDVIVSSDTVEHALDMMEKGRFRNIPVIDEAGNVVGNVTHYAFIKFLAEHFPQEIYNVPPDEGIHEDRYGG